MFQNARAVAQAVRASQSKHSHNFIAGPKGERFFHASYSKKQQHQSVVCLPVIRLVFEAKSVRKGRGEQERKERE
jgi:hypothetical protein